MPRMVFIERDGSCRQVAAPPGWTLLDIARENAIDIEGACDGSMACATCHVVLRDSDYDKLPAPSAEEEDMLDLAFGLEPTSRLGCQIVMTPALDGLVARLPDDGGGF